jgi:hypothetical protein
MGKGKENVGGGGIREKKGKRTLVAQRLVSSEALRPRRSNN